MKGNSLLEIIIVMAIFGLILTSLGSLSTTAEFLGISAEASALARGKAEYLLALSLSSLRQDFHKNIATTTIEDIFSQTIEIEEVDNFTRKLKSIVRWFVTGQEEVLELDQIITDPEEAFGSSDCLLDGSENWQSPELLSGHIDLGLGNQATGIFARGNIIYLSANNASPHDPAADKNDFFIIDASDPLVPRILSKMDTGPGLSSVVVVGPYAYLGNGSINSQLQVADISDPHQPHLIASYKLPGNYNDGTTIAQSLFYSQHRIYLGTAKSQIAELHIIDVKTPSAPLEMGRFETGAGINNIYASGHYLYLATPSNEELSILDASDPTFPKKIGGFDAPGSSGNGKSLARDRNTLYLGRTVGKNELFALDITDPNAIAAQSSFPVSDSINGIVASIGRLFLITNSKFEVIDSVDPTHLKIIGSVSMPAKPSGISCSGKYLYLSLLSSDGLRIMSPSI